MITRVIDPKDCQDLRSNEEKELQRSIVKQLCNQNKSAFLPLVEREASSNQPKNIKPPTFSRLDLSEGAYVHFSDSISPDSHDARGLPVIMTVHGIPGSQKDFIALQQETQSRLNCRWINYITPGLDRTDERRGKHLGYLEQTAHLMNEFLQRLHIDQPVVLIMHSGGGLFGKNFACLYPQRVRALVQLACIGISRWRPIEIETSIFNQVGVDVNTITRSEIDTEAFRVKFSAEISKFIQAMHTTVESEKKGLMLFKNLHFSDHMMLLKAQVGGFAGGFDEFFANVRSKLKHVPRFIAYSSIDNLLDETHIQHEIYEMMLADHATVFKMPSSQKDDIVLAALNDRKNLTTAYVFDYSDAGHAVQHVKAFDLSVKLAHFVKSLPLFEASNIGTSSSTSMRPTL